MYHEDIQENKLCITLSHNAKANELEKIVQEN